jgi:hypothetical protein
VRAIRIILASLFCFSLGAFAQTADELIAKNIQAHGGLDKIKAIKSLRMTGNFDASGFKGAVGQESKRPNMVRETFTIQGMTAIQAYDGSSAWQISPFGGKKDPELMGESKDLHDLIADSDIDGPLVDYGAKGNAVEYLGHDQVDGDDAYKLKVTLKNGDIFYYYFDPDTYLEIQIEKQQFVRGALRESVTLLGSYKPVDGVMYPFSIESGPKNDPDSRGKVTVTKLEANVSLEDKSFKMQAAPAPAVAQNKTGAK